MSKDFVFVNEKLIEFSNNINLLKYAINNESGDEQMIKPKEQCKNLSEQLIQKFRGGRYQGTETMKIQKLSKDFERLFRQYHDLLEEIKQIKVDQQIQIERQYNAAYQRRQTIIDSQREDKSDDYLETKDDQKEEEEPDLSQVQEIESMNPEIEHYGNLIQEKNNEIQEIAVEASEVYKIMEDVAKLTFEQGKSLDVAEDNINVSNANVKVAALELEGAQVEHKSYMGKMCGFIIAFIVVVVVVLAIIF